MSSFAVVISCLLNPTDTQKTVIVLDTVYDNNVSLSSTITTHPIANGDMMADHMYNDPDSMSIRGSFSLAGSKSAIVNNLTKNFQDTQDLFEKIKKEGVMCEVVKVQIDNENDGTQKPRFKIRRNMVLQGIQWVEKINTLDFTFNFEQALVADVEIAEINPDDGFLPNVSEPKTLSFTEQFMDLNEVTKLVVKQLDSMDLIGEGFLAALSASGAYTAAGVTIALAVAVLLSSNPAGWVVGAIIVVGSAIVGCLIDVFKKHKYKIDKFKLYNNAKKDKKERERFIKFIESIYKQVEKLNDKILVYGINSNEPQECLLSIDGQYYDFLFERSGSENPYSLKIKDLNDNFVGRVVSNIESSPSDLDQAGSSNPIMKTQHTDNYLILPPVIIEYESGQKTGEKIKDTKDLTSYLIVSSKIKLSEYMKQIKKIIKNAIEK